MKQINLLFLLCLSFALLIVSCARKPEQPLIGKWQEATGKEAIEFLKDGTFQGTLVWDLTNAPTNISGTFVVKGDMVELTVQKPADLSPMSWKIAFTGPDELTTVFQQGGAIKRDGTAAKYRRVK
jgi:hypothetical protein